MLEIREDPGGITFDVLVTPRASRAKIGPVVGDRLKIAVTAPPVDGEANAAIVETFAKALRIPRTAVEILRGDGSRRKTIRIAGVGKDVLERIL